MGLLFIGGVAMISRLSRPLLLALVTLSFGAHTLPAEAKSLIQRYERKYSEDYLKNHPLQFVKRTVLELTPKNGLFIAKWSATMRDIRTDETVRSEASGTCKPSSPKKKGPTVLTCSFGTEMSETRITPRKGGVLVTIPHGNGVRFNRKEAGQTLWAEMLLGEDADNNAFLLFRD
jgi:hypothetical protein